MFVSDNVCLFCAPASPRGRGQRSGAVGEEEGEPQAAGGAEDSDQTVRGGETPQGDGAPPTGKYCGNKSLMSSRGQKCLSPPPPLNCW